MSSLDRAPSGRSRPPVWLLAGLVLLAAGCDGDSLYSDAEVVGPTRTVASHTVSLSVPDEPAVPLGDSLPVTVSFSADPRSGGITRVGVTALAIHGGGRDTLVLRASRSFASPRTGSGRVSVVLHPIPRESTGVPRELTLEVFAYAVAANGACAAAVEPSPQQLGCATLRGDTVAFGARGFRREVTVVSPHSVAVLVTAPARAERDDTLARVQVDARSTPTSGGIVTLGITGIFRSPAGTPIAVLTDSVRFAAPGVGTANHTFHLTAAEVTRQAGTNGLPDSLSLEVHAFAVHHNGACVASTTSAHQRLPCSTRGTVRVASAPPPSRTSIALVHGRSAALPAGAGRVVDLVVDPRADRAYLSNLEAHQVEVLDLASMSFRPPVRVGSQPAGLALSRGGDTLIVANSGGINISFVPTSTLREDVPRRLEIPRLRLYEVKRDDHTDAFFYSYADRPMYVEQDAAGRLLYTTTTTEAAPVGTIRVAERQNGWPSWEPYLLFHERALRAAEGWVSLANVDSVRILGTRTVVVFDHVPGFPQRAIQGGPAEISVALDELRAQGSDALARDDVRWDIPRAVELSDTSFVAISGDRRTALFGEGVREPGGRLLLWSSDAARLSEIEDVRDLTQNTSDRIQAIDLNFDGSLGAARGERGIYFFGDALRLRGTTSAGVAGGSGIGLVGSGTASGNLAFAGTDRASILVIETTHFRAVGELPIRAPVVGPMEVTPPLAGENGGRACAADPLLGDPECLVARIVAVTADGVVSVDVHARDLRAMLR